MIYLENPGPCRIGQVFLFDLFQLKLVGVHPIFLREEFEWLPHLFCGDDGETACLTSIQRVLCSSFSLSWPYPEGSLQRMKAQVCGHQLSLCLQSSAQHGLQPVWATYPDGRKAEWKDGTCMENNIIKSFACILSPIQLSPAKEWDDLGEDSYPKFP